MMTPTTDDRFRYNLLAERINELGALLVAARRADPGFLSQIKAERAARRPFPDGRGNGAGCPPMRETAEGVI
jgi:hypothetical protein